MRRHRIRWRFAVVLVAALVAAGCSDSSDPNSAGSTASTSLTAPPTTSAAVVTTTNAPEATSTTLPAADSLSADLESLAAAYTFVSATSVDGTEALRIEGRRVDGATELRVSSAGALVDYVIAVDGSTWVRKDGDINWSTDDPLTIGDPLEPLRRPITVMWLEGENGANTYEAEYDANEFGLAAGAPLTLRIVTGPGEVTYRYESDGATVDAAIDASADVAPIDIPPT